MSRLLVVLATSALGNHVSPVELLLNPPKDVILSSKWANDLQQSLATFDQVRNTADQMNLSVAALGERVTGRAKAIADTLATYSQVVSTAKEINMTAEELEKAFEARARSIEDTVQNYNLVEHTAARMNMTVGQLAHQVHQRAQAVDEIVHNHEAVLAMAKKWNITVSPGDVQAGLPYPMFLGEPFPPSKTLEELAFAERGAASRLAAASGDEPHHDQQHQQQHYDQRHDPRQQQQQHMQPAHQGPPPPQDKPLLFVGIYSAPGDKAAQRRKEIRETYWNHPLLRNGHTMHAKFVVGWAPENSPEEKELEKEVAHRPNDFLRLNINERYELLTLKTMALLRWFAQTGPAKWLLKLDDDTFPHLDIIADRLRNERSRYVEMGLMFPCAPVLKETKWAEDPNLWNQSHFPKYMQGSGYFLSEDLIKVLAEDRYEHNKKFMLHNEDAAIGVWMEMAKVANPSLPLELKAVGSTLTGCQPGDLLSMNNQPGYMKCYWGRKLRGEEDICCYGPLNNLRQSFLQRSAVYHRHRLAVGCYHSSVVSTPDH